MKRGAILEQIIRRPPFDVIPSARDLIATAGRVIALEAGERLIATGDAAATLIIPISGGLCLEAEDGVSRSVPIQKFEVLGLREVLEGTLHERAIRAERQAFILLVPRHEFLSTLREAPSIERYLRLTTSSDSSRGLVQLLSEQNVSRADIVRVLARIRPTPLPLKKDASVPERPSIWFVETGELCVTHRLAHGVAARLGRRSFFGGGCLVSPFKCTYQATAMTDALVYELPALEACALLAELHLIPLFFDEPHLGSTVPPSAPATTGTCVTLPGRIVDAADVPRMGAHGSTVVDTSDARASLASIANLLRFLGIAVNTASLQASVALLGRLSHARIAEVIEPYGVVARATSVTLATLPRHSSPALLALRGRLCVLLATRPQSKDVILHDPARGFVRMTMTELAGVWDGMLLEPSVVDSRPLAGADETSLAQDRAPVRQGQTIRTILALLAEQRPLIVNIALLSVLTIAVSLVHPWLSQVVLDEVLTLRDTRVLVACTLGMLLAHLLHAGIRWSQQLVFAEFSSNFDARLGELFYRRALSLPMGFFSQHKAGDILARLRELEDLRELLSFDSLQALLQLASIVIVSAVLMFYSGPIAALVLVLGAMMVAFQFAIGGTLYKNSTASAREATRAGSLITEQVAAVSTVKAFGAARTLRERWERAYLRGRQLALQNEMLASGSTAILQMLGAIGRIGGLWIAARAALDEALTPGQILAISMYLHRVVESISDITGLFGRIWSVRTSFDNVRRIFDAEPEASWKNPVTTLSRPMSGRIQIQGLGFRYDDHSEWVLRGVDFTLYPGQMVALVGKSGCGKTTLAHLIAGNLRATMGHILYDGVDGELITLQSLRRHVGFVTQTHDLFQGTLGENISFGDDAPRDARIVQVSEDAHLAPVFEQLPGGLAAMLGEAGTGLSGGQMQRVSIARTLYRDPSVFIFDEATSQLDAESEQAIVDNLRRIRRDRTCIIIAHRLSTVRQADVIFVLKDQTIVDEGTHEQLMARGGHYTELFASQVV
jgi:ATP-binding cassette, subfamily B, bacterial HlyB/CyaB